MAGFVEEALALENQPMNQDDQAMAHEEAAERTAELRAETLVEIKLYESSERRDVLDEMVEIAEEAGMCDEDDFPTATR